MAINTNDLILKVSSRISDTVDGDTVLLIEQNIPTSIARVTKQVAMMKPKGHELLLKEQTIDGDLVTDANLEGYTSYKVVDIDTNLTRQIVADQKFHSVRVKPSTGTTSHRAFPMQSMAAIGLSTVHGKPCYFVEYPYMYFKYPTGFTLSTASDAVKITHYAYLPLSEFPIELEDFLVDDLLNLLQGEAQKQMVEESKTSVRQ